MNRLACAVLLLGCTVANPDHARWVENLPDEAGPCASATECGDATPVCDPVEMLCRACAASSECAESAPATPWCLPTGACGACENDCADNAVAPFCDAAAAQCRGCRDDFECAGLDPTRPLCDDGACVTCRVHSDCVSEVCDPGTGTCTPVDEVVYVDVESGADIDGCGSQAQPCASFGQAIDFVTATRHTLRLAASNSPYPLAQTIEVSGGTLVLLADGVQVAAPASGSALEVSGNAVVRIAGIRLVGAVGDGIVVQDATVELVDVTLSGGDARGVHAVSSEIALRQVTVTGHGDVGVEVVGGALTMERSFLRQNAGGGLSVTGASFDVTNSFIVDNGAGGLLGTFGGVHIDGETVPSPARFAFNTVAGNVGAQFGASGIACAYEGLTLSSNIVHANIGAAQVGGTCTHDRSHVQGGTSVCTGGGAPGFISTGTVPARYHLRPDSPCKDQGQASADVVTDYDGDARPMGAGHDVGADEAP